MVESEENKYTRGNRQPFATTTVRQLIRLPDGSWLVYDETDHYRFTMRPIEYDVQPGDTLALYGDGTYSWFGRHINGVRINGGPLVEASA